MHATQNKCERDGRRGKAPPTTGSPPDDPSQRPCRYACRRCGSRLTMVPETAAGAPICPTCRERVFYKCDDGEPVIYRSPFDAGGSAGAGSPPDR